MLHHPRPPCEPTGGHSGPASRLEQLSSVMSSHRVSRQGLDRVADSTAGIYEPVPGLLDTLVVPKVARPGAQHREDPGRRAGVLACEPILGPSSICDWVRADVALLDSS